MSDRNQDHLVPWGDDVALAGPTAPKWNGQITHLIQFLLTVHKRFGDTAITANLQWGATALHKRDEQKERIIALEAELAEKEKEVKRWLELNEETVSIVLQTFRREINVHMDTKHPSGSPGHDAMRIALRAAIDKQLGGT